MSVEEALQEESVTKLLTGVNPILVDMDAVLVILCPSVVDVIEDISVLAVRLKWICVHQILVNTERASTSFHCSNVSVILATKDLSVLRCLTSANQNLASMAPVSVATVDSSVAVSGVTQEYTVEKGLTGVDHALASMVPAITQHPHFGVDARKAISVVYVIN